MSEKREIVSPAQIARRGLEIGVMKLNFDDPFDWSAGVKMPIYVDCRLFLSHPELRQTIVNQFYNSISKIKDVKFLLGTSTGGIPWATDLSNPHELNLPMGYVRNTPKGHGLRNQIEGISDEERMEGKNAILFEDVISTGGSSARAINAIRKTGANCDYCLSIFDYEFETTKKTFENLDPRVETISVFDYRNLINVARDSGRISEEEDRRLREWKDNPFEWGELYGFK